jgi:hypothetical protein
LAECLAEALGLARIDLAQWQACLAHRAFEGAVIRARRLEDEAGDGPARDPSHDGPEACWCILELAVLTRWMNMNVERVFRNGNADGRVCHLSWLGLSCGQKAPVSVQADGK